MSLGKLGAAVPPSGPARWLHQAALLAEMVRVQEVAFSLPLAFAGAVLGARGLPPPAVLGWIVVAVTGGKVGGMALNRWADRDLDARHPETAGRHLPSGRVSPAAALGVAAGGLLALAVAAYACNPLCLAFLPAVAALVGVYSFTKRWGWGCHFALGAVGFFLPFCGWIAVTGRLVSGAAILGAAAACWYVGFDSLYALRDAAWDRQLGIHSLPADLGVGATLWISRGAHVAFLALLAVLGTTLALPWPWWGAVAACAAVLGWQHAKTASALRPIGFSRFNAAVSLVLLCGVALSAAIGLGS